MNGFFEKHQQNSGLDHEGVQVRASSGANDSGTCRKIGTPLTQLRSAGVHADPFSGKPRTRRAMRRVVSQFDSKQRRAPTVEREMQYGLLIRMLKMRAPLPTLVRQHEVMKAYARKAKPRIRVQAYSEVGG